MKTEIKYRRIREENICNLGTRIQSAIARAKLGGFSKEEVIAAIEKVEVEFRRLIFDSDEIHANPKGRERRPVSVRTRFEILKRDSFTCVYCGRKPPEVKLHVDHRIPVKHNGKTSLENLAASCQDCNSGKSGIPLTPEWRDTKEALTIEDQAGRVLRIASRMEQPILHKILLQRSNLPADQFRLVVEHLTKSGKVRLGKYRQKRGVTYSVTGLDG
jgi:hypothetical protein